METHWLISLAYLIAAVLFVVGLKMMSHPKTAVRGNLLGALGMLLAILMTLLDRHVAGYVYIAGGLLLGSLIGAWLAVKVQMTRMPQMVGLLNGLGGGASTLVAWADLLHDSESHATDTLIAVGASGIIGAVTFWGSLAAYAKLEEWKHFKKPYSLPFQQTVNAILLAISMLLIVPLALNTNVTTQATCYVLIAVLSSFLGVFSGRLNRRSRYLSSGAATFGSSIP